MNIINQKVPKGIYYISDWKDYDLPHGHCIVDKGVTGCGYTEYCLCNQYPIVLCSPRRLLLENKRDQHKDDPNILYLENTSSSDFQGITQSFREKIKAHYGWCCNPFVQKVPKFMVTYDSLKHVLESFKDLGIPEENFIFVADEFQSIFLDAYFKAETEFSFVDYLQGCTNVIYLSATPMLEKYLDMTPEFKDLPMYTLDWSETGLVENVVISRKRMSSISGEATKIINSYKSGKSPVTLDFSGKLIQSKEAVFFMNSVTDIIRTLKKSKLTPGEVNIICSNTLENQNKLKKAGEFTIGTVPLKDEPNKMFTFCTRSVYIGADFYSESAKSFVFADPNISSLALDISLDLPQIVGRQRDRRNPFRNDVSLYYKLLSDKQLQEKQEFDELQRKRRKRTEDLLAVYKKGTKSEQSALLVKFRSDIQVSQYSGDFVSISSKTGEPVYNIFIDISNERAWEVSQHDYQDNITVTKALESQGYQGNENLWGIEDPRITQLKKDLGSLSNFPDRLKIFCEFLDSNPDLISEVSSVPGDSDYLKFYSFYGTSGCSSRKFIKALLEEGMRSKVDLPKKEVLSAFEVGRGYTKSLIKTSLQEIRTRNGITGKSKASDITKYFKVSRIVIPNPVTGKKDEGFKIISPL